MVDGRSCAPGGARFVLLLARIIAGALMMLVLVTMVGEAVSPERALPTPVEMLGLAMFPIGVCVGYAIAWKRPMVGGLVSISCLAGFVVWLLVQRDSLRVFPVLLVFALPAVLMIVYHVVWGGVGAESS